MKMVTPKFLTRGVAAEAVGRVVRSLFAEESQFPFKRQMCHIVVLVPKMMDERPDYPSYPNYQIEPHVLYEHSIGKKWPYSFDYIAKCKALQLWHGRNDDRTDIMPHLLFPGDAPFWGGVKRDGIVVACSGVQPWFDKMISGMVADMCIALAYEYWTRSKEKEAGAEFIG